MTREAYLDRCLWTDQQFTISPPSGASASQEKHLPGRHDQGSHGNLFARDEAGVRKLVKRGKARRAWLVAPPGRPRGFINLRVVPRKDDKSKSQELNVVRDMRATNPNRPNPEYLNNCTHVVAAHELRRRGYDVVASPSPGARGRNSRDLLLQHWEGRPRPGFDQYDYDEIRREVASWPPGARGWATIQWQKKYGGGSHIFNVERTETGAMWIEAQSGRELQGGLAEYNKARRPGTYYSLARVDHLTPRDSVTELIERPPTA